MTDRGRARRPRTSAADRGRAVGRGCVHGWAPSVCGRRAGRGRRAPTALRGRCRTRDVRRAGRYGGVRSWFPWTPVLVQEAWCGASPRDQWCAAGTDHAVRASSGTPEGGGELLEPAVGLSGRHWSLLHVGHDVHPADRRSTDFRDAPGSTWAGAARDDGVIGRAATADTQSGAVRDVVQARDIHGGVCLDTPSRLRSWAPAADPRTPGPEDARGTRRPGAHGHRRLRWTRHHLPVNRPSSA